MAKMSRKKILDITSTKKKDVMTGWPDGVDGYGTQILQPGLSTDGHTAILWCPTLRRQAQGVAGKTTSSREAQEVYYRGLSERFTIKTSGSNPFRHRRIVITSRGTPDPTLVLPGSYFSGTVDPDDGGGLPDTNNNAGGITAYGRTLRPMTKTAEASMYDYLFAGYNQADWFDPMVAKVDNKRFTILSDQTRYFRSGNDAGIFATRKFWHPFNKMFTYEDKEFGGRTVSGVYCADIPNRLGNVFIMDIFEAIPNSTDQIALTCESTLYWHEK